MPERAWIAKPPCSIQVNFCTPTPIGEELLITGTLKFLDGRKACVVLSLSAGGEEYAKGQMLAVELKT